MQSVFWLQFAAVRESASYPLRDDQRNQALLLIARTDGSLSNNGSIHEFVFEFVFRSSNEEPGTSGTSAALPVSVNGATSFAVLPVADTRGARLLQRHHPEWIRSCRKALISSRVWGTAVNVTLRVQSRCR